jgi:hypothetical protein
MWGLLLPLPPRIPAAAFLSWTMAYLEISPEKALSAIAEDLRRICAAPSDHILFIGQT